MRQVVTARDICSRCRGTKAAFGDEVVAKTRQGVVSDTPGFQGISQLLRNGAILWMCPAGGCGLLDLVGLTGVLGAYPAFVSNRDMGFALTASHFAKAAK